MGIVHELTSPEEWDGEGFCLFCPEAEECAVSDAAIWENAIAEACYYFEKSFGDSYPLTEYPAVWYFAGSDRVWRETTVTRRFAYSPSLPIATEAPTP